MHQQFRSHLRRCSAINFPRRRHSPDAHSNPLVSELELAEEDSSVAHVLRWVFRHRMQPLQTAHIDEDERLHGSFL